MTQPFNPPLTHEKEHADATGPTHDEIAQIAWEFWDDDGRPEGKSEAYWLEAEAILKSERVLNYGG